MKTFKALFHYSCIALAVAVAAWISSFYRFPGREESVVILEAGIILGLLYRLGGRVLPALFIGLSAYHWLIRGYSMPVSIWVSVSLFLGWRGRLGI